MKQKLGIFGGTFNPVHLGHLIMVKDAMEIFDLVKVLFVPCAKPPHKQASGLIPASHRVAMLELVLNGVPEFELCDLEIKRGGTTYSIDTVRELRRRYPDQDLFFIIGSDSLPELHQWKNIEELLTLCRFVTLTRPGYDAHALKPSELKLNLPWPERLLSDAATGHRIEIASSDIRYRVAEGMSIRYLVPPAVEMYIAEHQLYNVF